MADCPFCKAEPTGLFWSSDLVRVMWDTRPLTDGHALVVPVRHVGSFFETSGAERVAIMEALDVAKAAVEEHHRPDGYNIGVNDGPAAGQTVPHCHIHLIPRYAGDTGDPRGGIRWMLPEKAKYWEGR